MKVLDRLQFMKSCGFHDNCISRILIEGHDLVIELDDIYANIRGRYNVKRPGSIRIKECSGLKIDYLLCDWIVDGEITEGTGGANEVLNLNTGAKIDINGKMVELWCYIDELS